MTQATDWLVEEPGFSPRHIRKYESLMTQGNGYMGIRGSLEERYERTSRCTLVAGTFDWAAHKNTTELPAAPDTLAVDLSADGIPLDLTRHPPAAYTRRLDLRDGRLERRFLWRPRAGLILEFQSERFVSLADRHVLGQRLTLTVLEGETAVDLRTGIQNLERPDRAHFQDPRSGAEGEFMEYAAVTRESGITFLISAWVSLGTVEADGTERPVPTAAVFDASGVRAACRCRLGAGQKLRMEKLCRVTTSRDRDWTGADGERRAIRALGDQGFDLAFRASAEKWAALWRERDIAIDGPAEDRLAARFAIFHLAAMAPTHDDRMNIAAKGLSGKGYFGHTFWDTEIYMLPYFLWEDPAGAQSLLRYRYRGLPAARRKAADRGWRGAMYPWEAAWPDQGETCPEDHFSKYEYHVTADVAYGVLHYYAVTGDLDFMAAYGCEILFETARFWSSRLEYDAAGDRYEIRDVIGPDEFTHHANNNAYTNHMAHANLEAAADWQLRLKRERPGDYARLAAGADLEQEALEWRRKAAKLVLPRANEDGVVPQDDRYLTLPEIDLAPYRAGRRKLRQDYPYPAYVDRRVSKQADVVNLLLLLGDRFPEEVKKASLDYYEPLCVHESSLSLCAYAMLAAECGETERAYDLFQRARAIDLGPDPASSDSGLHAASLGGIWQCCGLYFSGVSVWEGCLRIVPRLPAAWTGLTVRLRWRGRLLELAASHTAASVRVLEGPQDLTVRTAGGLLSGEGTLHWTL